MEAGVFTSLSLALTSTPAWPWLWLPHCILSCLAARTRLGGRSALLQSAPLSCYLVSLLYTYPGGILSQLLLARSPLAILAQPAQFAAFTAVWYLVCYTPLVPRLPGPALLLALLAQDLQRIGLVSAGVRAALALYPNTFLIPVLVATVKSSGFMLVKYYEHILLHGLDRGFSLPNHATKTMVVAGSVLTAGELGWLAASHSDLFTWLVLLAWTVRLSTAALPGWQDWDPYCGLEATACSVVFGREVTEPETEKSKKTE